MNKLDKFLGCFLIVLAVHAARAQALTGSKTIPGDYVSLASAISDLNTNGVGTGGVTFLIAAGYTEQAPAGGYLISATGTATKPIVFSRVGAGSNPLLYAPVGTSATTDGIVVLSGSDFVTLDGMDIIDTNTVSNITMMEWGVALVRASATDAPQNCTIRNCQITLNKANTASVGIYSGCHLASSVTPLTITSTGGAVSNCKLLKNKISNTYMGITLIGFADNASPYALYDQNNQIGSEANGNNISNFGGSTVAARGIFTQFQNNLLVSNNSVSGGTGTTATLHGIWVSTALGAQSTIHKNVIQDTSSSTSSGAPLYGIQSDAGTGSGGKATIDSNKVNFCYHMQATAGGAFYGIAYSGGADSVLVFGNQIDSNRITGTGSFYAIAQTGGGLNLNSRIFRNSIYANTKVSSGSGAMYMIDLNLNATIQVYANDIHHDTSNAIGFFYGIRSQTATVGEERYMGNNVSYMVGNSSGSLYAMYVSPSTNAGSKYLYDNQVWGLRSASGNVSYGIYAGNGLNIYVFRNKVSDFLSSNTSAGFSPIYLAGNNGTTINAYNNYVYDIRLTATASNAAIRGIHVASGLVNLNLYHNTVVLNSASTGAAITACLYLTAGGIGSQDIRNNLLVNNSTQAAGGRAIAYQRSGTTLNTHTAGSDGNLYYAGTPASARLIFYDGTGADSTLLQFKARMINRERSSVTGNVTFVNTLTQPYDMHLDPTVPTQCESAGMANSLVSSDFYGISRNPTTPDIGAEEGSFIAQDVLPPLFSYKPLVDTTTFFSRGALGFGITDLNAVDTTAGHKPRMYFKKQTEDNTFAGNTAFDNGWKYVEASNNVAPFSFTINASLLTSPLAQGDIIQYVVVAQDKSIVPNIGISSGRFASAPSNVALTATAFPIVGVTDSFTVRKGLNGTYTVGASSIHYTTLTQAAADLNNSVLTGPVTLLLLDMNYTSPAETFPISINANGGSSPVNTVTIKPQTGVNTTIGDNSSGAILLLNGIDYLTLDGKQNATSTGKSLVIQNTQTTPGASAVTWINDACFNKLTDLILKGSNTPSNGNGGVVVFGTGISRGNDGNSIDSCDITTASPTNLPTTLVYALGSNTVAEQYNDQNQITNCRLYDYWNAASECNALKITSGNNSWTISKNHIYQTTPRSTSATHYAFNFIHSGDFTSLNGMTVTRNYIGGSDVFCGGAPWTQLTSAGAFTNLFNMGGSVYSRFSQNTITNFVCNTSNTTTAVPSAWNAVQWSSGLLAIDSNTFGSQTDSNAIVMNSSSTTSGIGMNVVVAANFASVGTFSISGNTFGGIKVSNSLNLSTNLFVINVTSVGGDIQTYNINDNIIGNALDANIQALNSTSTTAQSVAAINFPGTFGFTLNVKNNTIRNLTNQYTGTGAGFTQGIAFNGSPTGTHTISNNTISNLINYAPQTNGVPTPNNTVSVMGLQLATTGPNSICSGNRIYNLVNTYTFPVNTCVVGINIRNVVNAMVSNNTVSRLTTASSSTGAPGASSTIYGIAHSSGSCRIVNNMISLGTDTLGNSITTTPTMAGIYKASSGSLGCYFNTVKITGTGVGVGAAATYGFRRATTGIDTIMNNIVENSRTNATSGGGHYAVHSTNGTTWVSDYNILYAKQPSAGDTLLSINGVAYPTIPSWTAVSGFDSNSKDTLVTFVSTNNLHLSSTMYGRRTFKGVPVNGIVADFDGELRTVTPYIGADEVPGSPLPVEWIRATATAVSGDVLLNWATASESGSSVFVVERSLDGKAFASVAVVNGHGNSNVRRNYQVNDADAFQTTGTTSLYYRIKQLDVSGAYTYSQVLRVTEEHQESTRLSVYPNPFEDHFRIEGMEIGTGPVNIRVVDLMGSILLDTTNDGSDGTSTLHLPGLKPGLYMVIITRNGSSHTLKLAKK